MELTSPTTVRWGVALHGKCVACICGNKLQSNAETSYITKAQYCRVWLRHAKTRIGSSAVRQGLHRQGRCDRGWPLHGGSAAWGSTFLGRGEREEGGKVAVK